MRPMTATAALLLAFAGAACSQETTEPAEEATSQVQPVAATEDDMGGFNLMIPGDDTAGDGDFGGFNLAIPGEETDSVLLPESGISDTIFGEATDLPEPEPADVSDDAPIRIDTAD